MTPLNAVGLRTVASAPPLKAASVGDGGSDSGRTPMRCHVPGTRRRLLRHGVLRQFLLSQGAGQIADAMTTLCLAQVIVFEIEQGASPTALGRVLVATSLPIAIAGPLAGFAADHWHRRRTLAAATAIRAVLTLAAVVVPLTGDPTIGYVVVGSLMAVARLLYTVRAAGLPHLVAADDLVAVDSMALLVGTLAGLVGAGLGAATLVSSPYLALGAAAMLHVAASLGFLRLPLELGGHGFTVVLRIPTRVVARRVARLIFGAPTRFAIAATSGHRFLLGAAFATYVLLADARYRMEASGYAAALAVMAVGGFLGTLTAPNVAVRCSRVGIAAAAYTVAGTAVLVGGWLASSAFVMAAMMAAAFAFQNLRLMTDALVQAEIADDALGRVFAAYDIVYNLAFVGGALTVVAFAPHQSADPFLVIGAAFLAGAVAHAFRARRSDDVTITRRNR